MKMSDELLALCELSNDLLFHKIPKEKYMYYIKNSLKCGEEFAEKYCGQNIRELYKKNGIIIKYSEEKNSYCGVQFRAHVVIDKKETIVTMYTKSLNEFSDNSSYQGNDYISYDTALDMHLCHEFYHFIEHKEEFTISEKLDEIVTIKLPFFTRKAHINRCSEIAAHAFAKKMLQLKYLPNIYDYIYMVNTGKMSREKFDELLNDLSQKLSD
ncbi:hypothetical protein [Clostridium sp. DL1XJH146]